MAAKEQDPIKIFIVGGDTVEQFLIADAVGSALSMTHGFKKVAVFDMLHNETKIDTDVASICDAVDRLRPNLFNKPIHITPENVLSTESYSDKPIESNGNAVYYQPLRSKETVWPDASEQLKASLSFAPEQLTHKALVNLTRELDRRFMQLVEKVGFEKEHDLVDYAKLKEIEK